MSWTMASWVMASPSSAHRAPIAQDDDAVAGLDDLVEPVRNEDYGNALRLEARDELRGA